MAARTYCKVLGIVTIIAGLTGFALPHLLGFHLTPVHNAIHLLTGAVACWVGFGGGPQAPRTFCRVFGVVYGLVAVLGFAAPQLLGTILGHPGLTAADLMPDNLLHVLIALSSLVLGWL